MLHYIYDMKQIKTFILLLVLALAPWHAMNYAIYWYNENRGSKHPCTMHYESNTIGYQHRYPTLTSGKPGSEATHWNPLQQPN